MPPYQRTELDKNASGERDPEMHQTKKGNQWFFGMKGHVGVDKKTKLIHSVAASAANERDNNMLPELLHGRETRVYGQGEMLEALAPAAKDLTQKRGRGYKYLKPRQRISIERAPGCAPGSSMPSASSSASSDLKRFATAASRRTLIGCS